MVSCTCHFVCGFDLRMALYHSGRHTNLQLVVSAGRAAVKRLCVIETKEMQRAWDQTALAAALLARWLLSSSCPSLAE